jgi:hypothetical protein
MNPVQSQILTRIQTLSEDKQQEVLDFVEFLISRTHSQAVSIETPSPGQTSFVQAAQQYLGCAEGPEDLSTNPQHMKGYGA